MVTTIPVRSAAQAHHSSPAAAKRCHSDLGLSAAKVLALAAAKKQQARRVSAPARLQRLPRPARTQPSRKVLEAVDPALADVPTDYICDMLAEQGASMYAAAAAITTSVPRSSLPDELEIILADATVHAPTHMLAVHSPLGESVSGTPTKLALYPVHDLVLAATCSRLPSLRPRMASSAGTKTTVPVQSVGLPAPAAFPLLLAYLYTHRADALLAGLLALRNGRPEPRAAAARVHGVWQDAAALGVSDERLWDTLDLAWTAISAGAASKR